MSLFPAYGSGPGSGRGRGGGQWNNNNNGRGGRDWPPQGPGQGPGGRGRGPYPYGSVGNAPDMWSGPGGPPPYYGVQQPPPPWIGMGPGPGQGPPAWMGERYDPRGPGQGYMPRSEMGSAGNPISLEDEDEDGEIRSGSGGRKKKRKRDRNESPHRKRRRSRSRSNSASRQGQGSSKGRRRETEEERGRGGSNRSGRGDRDSSAQGRYDYDYDRGGGGGYRDDRQGYGQGQQNQGDRRGGRAGFQDQWGGGNPNHHRRYEQFGVDPSPPMGGFFIDNEPGGQKDGFSRGGGRRGRDWERQNEEQRLNISQRFPKKVFLEETNLAPEYAFRLEAEANRRQLNFHAMPNAQKSTYNRNDAVVKVMGATDHELVQIYSKWSKFRCIVPEGLKEGEGLSAENRPKPKCETQSFIAISEDNEKKSDKGKNRGGDRDRVDLDGAFESEKGIPKKEGELSMKEMIEMYNKRVREEPRNIELWKEFVEFQDRYFDEHEQVYSEDRDKKKKQKRNKKALLEKKVAILDKALDSNPKSLELLQMRLNFLSILKPPEEVLKEWKKLVMGNQHVVAYWMEYFRFAVTQLQVYSNQALTRMVLQSFQRFRQMLTPSFPSFQRPMKILLALSDMLMCLSLVLRNSGYREKAIAIHQAQFEVDFNPPETLLTSQDFLDWEKLKPSFEEFWEVVGPKFGEPGALGWSSANRTVERKSIGVSDSKVSEMEESYFEVYGTDDDTHSVDKSKHWLLVESWRSKFQWLPWRPQCSDIDDAETTRVVIAQDVSSAVVPIPLQVEYLTPFDKSSAKFRRMLNFLQTLQEDFVPQLHTTSCLINPFLPIALTESRSLASELFYWRKLLNLYVPDDDLGTKHSVEPNEPQPIVKIPEGFWVQDWCTPNGVASKCEIGRKPMPFDLRHPDKINQDMKSLLSDNETSVLEMIRRVVDQGIDKLEPEFATVLCESYFRFEQKNTVASKEGAKARKKMAKNLLQKPVLRNTLGPYFEYAMLEYFEGNKKGATDVLESITNLGTTLLTFDDATGFVDIETNWATIAEATRLYNRLAEMHLCSDPHIAHYALTMLGSGFKNISLSQEDKNKQEWNSSVEILKATRNFEKILSLIVPGIEEDKDGGEEDKDNPSVVFPLSNEMLGRWGGDTCIDYLGQRSNLIVEWTKAFALFQFLTKDKDFKAASEIYEKVLERVQVTEPLSHNGNYDSDIAIRHLIREQLYIGWCNLGAYVLSKDPMVNSKFRNILGKALEEFPSSPPLLILFTDVENQMSIAGKLWRMMVKIVKQDKECNHWTPLLMGIGLAKKIEDLERDEALGLTSFGLGGPAVPPDTIFYKLDSLLTVAQENRLTRNCPLVWRVHMKLLALRTLQAKDVQRARATFYEAIRNCPSSKAIYMDGISYFPDLLSEVTDLMEQKQLLTRLPLAELDVQLADESELPNKDGAKEDVIIVPSDDEA